MKSLKIMRFVTVFLLMMCVSSVCMAGRVQLNEVYGAEKFVENANWLLRTLGVEYEFTNVRNEGVNSEGLGVFKATFKERSYKTKVSGVNAVAATMNDASTYGTLTIWANPEGYIYQWRLSSNGKYLSDANVSRGIVPLTVSSAAYAKGSDNLKSMVEEVYKRGQSVRYGKHTERYYRMWTKKNNQGGIVYIMEAYDEMP